MTSQTAQSPSHTGDLLPCPFCGDEARMVEFGRNFEVTCIGCYARGLITQDKAKAFRLWNTRATSDADGGKGETT